MYSTEEKVGRNSVYFLNTPTDYAKSIFLYPLAIGEFNYLPEYSLYRNRYDSYLIILVESGSMEILLENDYVSAPKNSAVILNCYIPHAYRTDTGCKALWIHFDGKMAGSYYDHLVSEKGNIITLSGFGSAMSLLKKLNDSFKEHIHMAEAEMSLSINNLLLLLLKPESSKNPMLQDGIQKVTSYITDNFHRDISLYEMADIAGFSPYYFTRRFKKETGYTPHQFLLSTRLAAARYNLSNTEMTVSEISNSCGFTDESAFCYFFKKREGMTPTEYKKRSHNVSSKTSAISFTESAT